mgnify:CR=1 FL=1|jgi:hypothetical protein
MVDGFLIQVLGISGENFHFHFIFYTETPTFAVLSQAAGMVPG